MQPGKNRSFLGRTVRRAGGGFLRRSLGRFLMTRAFARGRRRRSRNEWTIFSAHGTGSRNYFPGATPEERRAFLRGRRA